MQPSPFPASSVRLRNAWQSHPELAIEHHFRGDVDGNRRCEETAATKPVWMLSGGRAGEWKSTGRCPGAARISSRPSHRERKCDHVRYPTLDLLQRRTLITAFPQTYSADLTSSIITNTNWIHRNYSFHQECLTFHRDHTLQLMPTTSLTSPPKTARTTNTRRPGRPRHK